MSADNQVINDFECEIYSTLGEKLYLSEKVVDFHFIFKTNDSDGEYERVPAHKNLLVAGSDVFEVMFNGTWKEKNEVEIIDASIAAFKEFLQFFYLKRVKLTSENVAKVMYLADKYNLADGLKVCAKFIEKFLTDDNILWGYDLAMFFKQEKLRKYIEAVISVNAKKIFTSKSFLECDRDILGNILNLDSLKCLEMELFEACISWVKSSRNLDKMTKEILQAELGDLMEKIRFGSMSSKELAALDRSYGDLFSIHEYKDIIQMMGSDDYKSKIFTDDRRKRAETIIAKSNPVIKCNRLISEYCSTQPYYIKDVETTIFSCNQPLLLNSFVCDNIFEFITDDFVNSEKTLPTSVKITEKSDLTDASEEVVLYTEETVLQYGEFLEIILPQPILIKTGNTYKIQMQQTPPDDCCTAGLLKSNVKIQPDIIVEFYDDPVCDIDVTVTRGMISILNFKNL